MKKFLSIIFLFALLASSCSQDELVKNQTSSLDSLTFTASLEENESRTYIEDGNLLRWTEGDQISLFVANTLNRQYQFDGETGDNSGTFSIVNSPFGTGNDLNCHYAVYPYASNIKITEKGVITATLPTEQSYAVNSFGLGANTMVAVTKNADDTFLRFKNVGGYLKLQLYGDNVTVKTITLKGNSNEKIAGKATITPLYGQEPSISMADDATETITLNCGEGVKIGTTAETATALWMVVPPTTFEKGFIVTLTDINGNTFTQSTSKEIVIERNVIHPMKAIEVEIESVPTNQIWYTSSDGKIVTPREANVFGACIISNVYKDGKGVITFDKVVTTIGEYAFRGCSSLTSIDIPCSVIRIETQAFRECYSLVSFTIPKSVTSIDNTIFDECSSLSNIVVESSNSVYDSRENCNAIVETETNILITGCKNTTIPNSVTSIGGYAFFGRYTLINITIPNSITNIGSHAFRNCSSLVNIAIPNSVTSIGEGAFGNCSSLASIVVDSSNSVYDSRENCNAIIETASNTLISGCKNTIIPNSVTTIGSDAFVCRSLANITIPNSVTSINSYGFYFCSSLTDITIPNSVSSIGDYAFRYCSSLTRVDIEATIPPTLGLEVFANCSNDLKIYVPAGSLEAYKAADNWKDLNINEETIPTNQIWYTSNDGTIVIPYDTNVFGANIVSNVYENGKGIITFDNDVAMVGDYAFLRCASLIGIILPNTVVEIGERAFYYCTSLVNTVLPKGVVTIKNEAFVSSPLTTITIPNSLRNIGDEVFNNNLLSSIIVEQGNPVYDSRENCNAIIASESNILIMGCKNTIIPNGITSIAPGAFRGCSSLKNITIPNSVTQIDDEAFCGTGLTNVIIPEGVTRIGNDAFYACIHLSEVAIPSSVTGIGDYAFEECTSLKDIYVNATTPPTIAGDTFNNCSNDMRVHVPAGRIAAYNDKTTYWQNFYLLEGDGEIVAIDLGLSVKWANCNIGANRPEEYGSYYAWGETEAKKMYEGDEDEYEHYKDGNYIYIGSDIASTKYDTAKNIWGGKWHMPTKSEIDELIKNCSFEWTRLNGIYGGIFISKKNGNSVFLPVEHRDKWGYYWSSTQNEEYPDEGYGYAYTLEIYGNTVYRLNSSRYIARNIRPVTD